MSIRRLIGVRVMTLVMVRRRVMTMRRSMRWVNGHRLRLHACLGLCLGGSDSFGSSDGAGGGRSRSGAESDGEESGEAHFCER